LNAQQNEKIAEKLYSSQCEKVQGPDNRQFLSKSETSMSDNRNAGAVYSSTIEEEDWKDYAKKAADTSKSGNYAYSEVLWLAALEEAESFGKLDARLAATLEGLAECYFHQGKLRAAEQVGRRAYEIQSEIMGSDSLDLAFGANNLALIYHQQNKYGQAEPLYKRSLEMKTRLLGASHPEVIATLNNLASLLRQTHREAEADLMKACAEGSSSGLWTRTQNSSELSNQASTSSNSQMKQPVSPPKTEPPKTIPATAATARPPAPPPSPNRRPAPTPPPVPAAVSARQQAPTPLAANDEEILNLKSKVSEYEEMIRLLKIKIDQLEKMPTESHVAANETWEELRDKAREASAQGKLEESQQMWSMALEKAETYGAADPRLAFSLDGLGQVLFSLEKFGQAEMVWKRALEIKRKVLGDEHASVAFTANNLARLHFHLARFSEAEQLGLLCIKIYSALNGPDSVETAWSLHNQATLYHVQGRYEPAEDYYRRSLLIRKTLLGPSHPDTENTIRSYGNMLQTLGRVEEAASLSHEATQLITGSWKTVQIDPNSELQH
jgi:tetratricopeptide (TPR) repeat protein